jgi:hypothetical protein
MAFALQCRLLRLNLAARFLNRNHRISERHEMSLNEYVITDSPEIDSQANAVSTEKRQPYARTTASGLRTVAASLLFFLLSFIAIRHAWPTGIILYQGVVLALCISLAQFLLERRRVPRATEAAKNTLLTFLLIYSFVFTIPTTVDRAYSVRMITRLDRSPDGLTRDQINDTFVHGLLNGGVDKRLSEQTSTGSIRELNGRYSLTRMGRFLSAAFRFAQVVFACPEKQ